MSIIIGIDHGYYAIKTAHCSFPAGLTSYGEHEPYTRQGLLEFGGCFFVCGSGRQPIQRDKTVNDNYYLLTLAAIAKEIQQRGLPPECSVRIAAGLPLTSFGRDKPKFRDYLLRSNQPVNFKFEGVEYSITIPLQRYFAMRNRCSYAGLVSAYFSVYLAGTKNVSTNTIYSYRDTFVIFHGYLEKYCGFKLEKMLFNDLSRELILEFLQYLETERKCSISSRNQRLAALKSFAKYVQIECPDEMILCQRILSIDSKKAAKPTVQYLSNQQTDILMEQPDISTPKGRRDLAMILLLYDSAARVQELCDLRICDIRIDSLPVVHLLGKGRKSRDVPLTKPCAQVLRQYICENHLDIPERRNDQLFTNPQGKKLTRSGVSYVLAKYSHKANTAVDSFFPQITPHCLRHSKAMHLVEAGKNLIYIRDFLGHESIETTQVYAKANPEARRKALETMDTRMNTPAMPDWNDDPDLKAFLKTL